MNITEVLVNKLMEYDWIDDIYVAGTSPDAHCSFICVIDELPFNPRHEFISQPNVYFLSREFEWKVNHLPKVDLQVELKRFQRNVPRPKPETPMMLGVDEGTGRYVLLKSNREARRQGYDPYVIGRCCIGEQQTHHRFKWRYIGKADAEKEGFL